MRRLTGRERFTTARACASGLGSRPLLGPCLWKVPGAAPRRIVRHPPAPASSVVAAHRPLACLGRRAAAMAKVVTLHACHCQSGCSLQWKPRARRGHRECHTHTCPLFVTSSGVFFHILLQDLESGASCQVSPLCSLSTSTASRSPVRRAPRGHQGPGPEHRGSRGGTRLGTRASGTAHP